ncbi:MAG: glycosyltransferase family 9 protein [Ignavibacteriaceae bacterium]|nr:glycosyltransferase family 9 protein [Ignavibacteriaceae bacterium]
MIKPNNLLIVRTDRIGDVVLSLPLAELIKKHYPDCRITFLLKDYTKSLVEGHPFIDNILILKEKNNKISLIENILQIKKNSYDAAVVVYPTFITALIIFLSRIHSRIGTGYRWYSALFNNKVYEHRKNALRHELEYNVNLLKYFGIEESVNPSTINFNLKIAKKDDERVTTILKVKNIDLKKPVIIIHPGSGGSSIDLPLNKFKELVDLIHNNLTAEILITGSKSEIEYCHNLVVSGKTKNLAGLFNLGELKSLINHCDIFIANSTGPLHIAAALGKNVIGFYPKIPQCSAKRWGPYSNKSIVFTPELECFNCTREQCEHLDCMNSITVSKIFAEIEKIYKFVNK